jgi:hypothetical protein
MNKTQRRKLEIALRKLEKCSGNCIRCEKCHIYTSSSERAIYMAVGCDNLPTEMFSSIADVPSELHQQALETVKFELS